MSLSLNKKGIGHIAILVVLVLLLVASCLFIFVISSSAKIDISGVSTIYSYSNLEEQTDFFLKEVGKKATTDAFITFTQNTAEGNRYIKNLQEINGFPIFENLDDKLGEKFSAEVKRNFIFYFDRNIEGWEKLDFSELKKKIDAGEFEVFYKEGVVNISFKNFQIGKELGGVSVKRNIPDLEVDLNKINLESFEDIYLAKEKCKTKESPDAMKTCFSEELKNFEVTQTNEIKIADKIYYDLVFSSRQEFGDRINFGFIPK